MCLDQSIIIVFTYDLQSSRAFDSIVNLMIHHYESKYIIFLHSTTPKIYMRLSPHNDENDFFYGGGGIRSESCSHQGCIVMFEIRDRERARIVGNDDNELVRYCCA